MIKPYPILILLMIIFSSSIQAKKLAQKQPNLLIIFTDEHRRPSMGFWQKPEYQGAINGVGDPVITPNLDKLASEGVVFTQAMSTHPVCSPHRAMLLSGRFASQNGVWKNCVNGAETDLKEDLECYTDVLYDEGYNTAYFGKCHWIKPTKVFDQNANYVGDTSSPGGYLPNNYDIYIPPGPDRHSIEYWYQVIKDNHFSQYVYSNDPVAVGGKSDGEMYPANEFSSKHEARTIIDYLKNTREQRDANKPFCITWSLNPPHPPFSKITDCEEESYNLYKNMTHDALFNRPNKSNAASDLNAKVYFANVTSTDKYIGQVIKTLDSLGLGENTLVVFTSDHGEMLGSHGRMHKNSEYEESFGVPLIMRYKGLLQHKIDNLLIGTTDLYPTFLGLMGLPDLIPKEVAGTDHSDIIKSPQSGTGYRPISTPYLSIEGDKKGLRTNKYTFMVYGDGSLKLYNNVMDPYQQTNLNFNSLPANDQKTLKQELGYWLELAKDPWVDEHKNPHLITYSTAVDTIIDPVQQLVLNPDFETGSLSGWNSWNNGVTNNSNNVYKGNWSGYIKSGSQGSIQQNITLQSNTKYRFSAWAKVSNAGESASLMVVKYNENNDRASTSVNSTEYKQYSIDFTTGKLIGPITFTLYKSKAEYGAIYVDNFELIEAGDIVTHIKLEVENKCSTIIIGQPYQMSAEIAPVTAIDKSITWSIHNGTGSATISNEGVLTGIAEGTAEVIATANDASGKKATFPIHILKDAPVLNHIDLVHNLDNNTIALGETAQFNAVFNSEHYCDQSVIWSVENLQGEASINTDGILKPKAVGDVKVKATSVSDSTVSGEVVLQVVLGETHNYYVDASLGNDANDGLSQNKAWKTISKVNASTYSPGDSVLFKAGEIWNDQLEIECDGAKGHPIVFSRYGDGPKPQINGMGQEIYAVRILNSNYTEVSEFDITNKGATAKGGRFGVYLLAQNKGSIYETVVKNLDIHDVNGDKVKANGGGAGIHWRIEGTVASRFVDALIQGNHIYDCQRNGIGGSTAYGAFQGVKEYYSSGMKIRQNLVERIPGDGIVALGCDGAIVEYNICRDFTNDLPVGDAAAGIWPWNSLNTIIQHNEVSGHMAGWDGQGFDSDYNCEGTIIQYNYSHDNAGGFILICSTNQYGGYNNNTIVRYNISINDGFRTWGNGANFCPSFHVTGNVVNTKIYNNTIYLKPKPASVTKEFMDAGNWGNVWPNQTYFWNNIFYATESSGFDLKYSKNIQFSHNLYYGPISKPTDLHPINGDPKFVNPGESTNVDDYKLLHGSSALNSGKLVADNGGFDFFGNPVSAISTPNIGAYNGDALTVGVAEVLDNDAAFFSIFPNPIVDSVFALNIKQSLKNATIKIFTLTGKEVYAKRFNTLEQGFMHLSIDEYRSGMYIILVETPQSSQSLKFIKR